MQGIIQWREAESKQSAKTIIEVATEARYIPTAGIKVHATIAADARCIPTVGIRIQAKRNDNRGRCKIYSNRGDQNPSKAQKGLSTSPQGATSIAQGITPRNKAEQSWTDKENRGVVCPPPLLVCSYFYTVNVAAVRDYTSERRAGP